MPKIMTWDLPVRLFHWLYAGGFVAAALIALVLGEHSSLFPYHAIIGLALAGLIAMRLLWGLCGSRYARLSSLAFGPGAILVYFRRMLGGAGPRHQGHNPASAYVIVAMIVLTIVLAVTGVILGQGNESVKEVHEIAAYAMLVLAGVHVLGLVLHMLRWREAIALSMIHGRKPGDPQDEIRSVHPIPAIVMVLIVGAWVTLLVSRYEATSRTLSLPGLAKITVGEADHSHERKHEYD